MRGSGIALIGDARHATQCFVVRIGNCRLCASTTLLSRLLRETNQYWLRSHATRATTQTVIL